MKGKAILKNIREPKLKKTTIWVGEGDSEVAVLQERSVVELQTRENVVSLIPSKEIFVYLRD